MPRQNKDPIFNFVEYLREVAIESIFWRRELINIFFRKKELEDAFKKEKEPTIASMCKCVLITVSLSTLRSPGTCTFNIVNTV